MKMKIFVLAEQVKVIMEIRCPDIVKIFLLLCTVFFSLHFNSVYAITHVEISREVKEIIIQEKIKQKERLETYRLLVPYLHWLYKYCWHLAYDEAKPIIQGSVKAVMMLLDARQTYEEITDYIHSFFQGHQFERLRLDKPRYLRDLVEATSMRMYEYIRNYQICCQNALNEEIILFNAYGDNLKKGILRHLIFIFQKESGVMEAIKNIDLSNSDDLYSLMLVFYGLNGLMVKNSFKDDFVRIRERVIRTVFPALLAKAKSSERDLSNLLHFTVFMADPESSFKREILYVSDYKNVEEELSKFESDFALLPHWRSVPIISFTTHLAQVESGMPIYQDYVVSPKALDGAVTQQTKAEKESRAEPDSVSGEKQPSVVITDIAKENESPDSNLVTKQHLSRAKSKKRERKRKRERLAKEQQTVTKQKEKVNDGESIKRPDEKHETAEEEPPTAEPLAVKPEGHRKKVHHPVVVQQPKVPKKKKKKKKQTEESTRLDSNATPEDQSPSQDTSVQGHKKKECQKNPELAKQLNEDFHTYFTSLVSLTIQNPHELQVSGYNAMQLQMSKLYGKEPVLSRVWEFVVEVDSNAETVVKQLLIDAQEALDITDYHSQIIMDITFKQISLLVTLKQFCSPTYRIDIQYTDHLEEGDTIGQDEIIFVVTPLKVLLLQSLVNSNICDINRLDFINQWTKLESEHQKMGELQNLFEWSFEKTCYKHGEWAELDNFIAYFLPMFNNSDDCYIDSVSVLPKHLICSTCRQPLYGPTRTPCQKVFCKGCINSWPRNRFGQLRCPVVECGDFHAPNTFFRDENIIHELKSLQAKEDRFDFNVKRLMDKNLVIKFLGGQIDASALPNNIHSLPVENHEVVLEETGGQKKETSHENPKDIIQTSIKKFMELYRKLIISKQKYYEERDPDKKVRGRNEVKRELLSKKYLKEIALNVVGIINHGGDLIQSVVSFEESVSREDIFSILLAMESSLAVYIELRPDIKRYQKKHDIQTISNSDAEKYFNALAMVSDVKLKKDQRSDKGYHSAKLLLLHLHFRKGAFTLFNVNNLLAIFPGVSYLQILNFYIRHFSLASSSASPTDYYLFWEAYMNLFKEALPQLKVECISSAESCQHLMAATLSQMNEWLERLACGEFAHDSIPDETISKIGGKLNDVLRLNLSLLDREGLEPSGQLKASMDLLPSEKKFQSKLKKSESESRKAFQDAALMMDSFEKSSKEKSEVFNSHDNVRRTLLKRKATSHFEKMGCNTEYDTVLLHEAILNISNDFQESVYIASWFAEFKLAYFNRRTLQASHVNMSDVIEKAVLQLEVVKKINNITQEFSTKHQCFCEQLYDIADSKLGSYHNFLLFNFIFAVNRYLEKNMEEMRKSVMVTMIIVSDLLQLQTNPYQSYKKNTQQLDRYLQEIENESRRVFGIIWNMHRLDLDLQQGLPLLQKQASELPLPAPWQLFSVNPGNCLYEALLMGNDQQHRPPSIDQIKSLRLRLHELFKKIIAYIKLKTPDEAKKLWSELAVLTGMDQESLETVINSNYLLTPVLPDTSIADAWALEGEVSLVIPLAIMYFHSSIAVFSHPDQNNAGFLEPEVMGIVSTWVNAAPTLLNLLIEDSIVDISAFPQSQSVIMAIAGNDEASYSSLVDSPPSFGVVHSGAASGSSFTGSSHFSMAAVVPDQLTELPSVINQTSEIINQLDRPINNSVFFSDPSLRTEGMPFWR